MKKLLNIVVLLLSVNSFAQATDSLPEMERTIKVTDPFYREDQFYLGVTHSLLTNKPQGLSQRSISVGTSFGLLRDIPLNKQRTFSIAPGAGLAFYNLRHNLVLVDKQTKEFQIESNVDKNVQNLMYVEIPLEIRWRTSKVHSHKFWRVYTGVKYSYLLNSTTKYNGNLGNVDIKKNDLVSKSNLGVYVSAGFNTWNLYAYYGFKPLYTKGVINQNDANFNMVNLGLMFYIL